MHTVFIILHLVAAIAAVLLVIGIVSILKGLVFKIEKTIKTGTIITAVAVFLLMPAHFAGKMHCAKTCGFDNCNTEMKCQDNDFDKCMMKCDHSFCKDSVSGDSCKMYIEKKVIMKDHKACDPTKCDTSLCKHKCPHAK